MVRLSLEQAIERFEEQMLHAVPFQNMELLADDLMEIANRYNERDDRYIRIRESHNHIMSQWAILCHATFKARVDLADFYQRHQDIFEDVPELVVEFA